MADATRLQQSRDRVQVALFPIAQCALAAGLAWSLAQALFDHDRPFFASVAAVVCLSVRQAQRLRRVAELAVGVTVGVLVGELLVRQIGTGAWQIAVVVAIALLLAVALDGGPLLTVQSGLQAVFVVGLPRVPGAEIARWEDALVGGATALLVAALVPTDPWRRSRRAAGRAAMGLAEALRQAAQGARTRDPAVAADALASARGTQIALDDWAEQLATGRDVARLSPLRRDRGGAMLARGQLLEQGLQRATRNMRVLVRRVLFAVETDEALPERLPELLDGLAVMLQVLAADPDSAQEQVRPAVQAYAAGLDPRALPGDSLSTAVVIAQLRSAVVDLLEGLGMTNDEARSALPALR